MLHAPADEIDYDAGYGEGADDAPEPLRHAVLVTACALHDFAIVINEGVELLGNGQYLGRIFARQPIGITPTDTGDVALKLMQRLKAHTNLKHRNGGDH